MSLKKITCYLLPYAEYTHMKAKAVTKLYEDFIVLGVQEEISIGNLILVPKRKEIDQNGRATIDYIPNVAKDSTLE